MNSIYRCLCRTANPNSPITFNKYAQFSFKSAISLENIYPNSSNKIKTIEKVVSPKEFTGFIPIDQLEITYSRSSGPGGQNVNTVNTKVDLRFNVSNASWLNHEIKTKLLEKFKTKINKEGYMIFRSDVTRSQQLNLADCLGKVRAVVHSVCLPDVEVSEETEEKIRKRRERAARERLMSKRHHSYIKNDRQAPTIY